MAILVEGPRWRFYLPAEQGSCDERRVYLLDLIERSAEESAGRLLRYLAAKDVRGGRAYDAARSDYRSERRKRIVADALPKAWAHLLAQPSPELAALLAAEVESQSGYRPADDLVADFLSRRAGRDPDVTRPSPAAKPLSRPRSGITPTARRMAGEQPAPTPPAHAPPAPSTSTSALDAAPGFWIGNAFTLAPRGIDILVGVFRVLALRDPSFLERFDSQEGQGRRRRYIARRPEDLNPTRPDLTRMAREIVPGWYIDANNSTETKRRLIENACRVAGLTLGADVRVRFPGDFSGGTENDGGAPA